MLVGRDLERVFDYRRGADERLFGRAGTPRAGAVTRLIGRDRP
jgi:hypothetical protein